MRVLLHLAAGALLGLFLCSCGTRSYDCNDAQIQPVFVGFKLADIDTLVLRKFRPGTNYQALVDTFVVKYRSSGYYSSSHDTTTVYISDYERGIKAGYDWRLVIPAKHRLIAITNIKGEKNTGKCTRGIFSMDPWDCQCDNKLFSAKADTSLIDFSGLYPGKYRLIIK